jgi:hypothetical protein
MPSYSDYPPFLSSGGRRGAPQANTNRQLEFDNLLRRELKVGDPGDAGQVANALLERYKADPRAQAMRQEEQGLPFLPAYAGTPAAIAAPTSSDAELQQAIDDVNRDLQELTGNALLKDVAPELRGWSQSIRSAIAEGANAARFGLDSRQRDKAFAIRRQLGDYARMARLVGAVTPSMNMNYRKLAQSLDEVGSVLLVLVGEALANVGFAGGRFLLQAPYSELQVRRDAAIYALRNLVGATQEAYGPNDWPRGLDAYRRLFDMLENNGQGDLRALLLENELARTMDELIERAAHGTADGLRALGSTAFIDLERFRRLVAIGQRSVTPESPPLTSFLEALQLFADAFDTSGGFRLMRIARPPILFYGLYGASGLDAAERRLLDLIVCRGHLADLLDCFTSCACDSDSIYCQVLLDKALYDLDRAIDLYVVGKENFGPPERRAAAYGFVIRQMMQTHCGEDRGPADPNVAEIFATLEQVVFNLWPAVATNTAVVARLIDDLLGAARLVRGELDDADLCDADQPHLCEDLAKTYDELVAARAAGKVTLADLTPLHARVRQGLSVLASHQINVRIAPSVQQFFGGMLQELCIQADMESRWESLVQTMAPSCISACEVANRLSRLVNEAIREVSGEVQCQAFQPSIPPHFETSLDGLADDVDRIGTGRPLLPD